MQSDNGIIGDASSIDLPQAPVDETAINELRKKAKYSRSKEYGELRAKADQRIDFYQKFLPDGRLIGTVSREELQFKWELANLLIAEFQQLFGEVDTADELLKELFDEQ